MNEMQRQWDKAMYENEIAETKENIKNEKLWALGSSTKDEENMHLDNIKELEEYIDHLYELIAELRLGDED